VTLDEHDVVTGTVGCAMDITERIARELERERLTVIVVEAAERERLQRERLEFLSAINDSLFKSNTVQELMTNVTRTVVPRVGDWCSIHVLPFTGGSVPDVEVAHVDPAMVDYALELQARFPYDQRRRRAGTHRRRPDRFEHRELPPVRRQRSIAATLQRSLLEPGDVIVFYTDGATDVRPPHHLDRSRFLALVEHAAARGTTAESIAERVRIELETVLAFNHRNDDIALLVCTSPN
jgi:Stage II sporulation protein E (SpoIIE)